MVSAALVVLEVCWYNHGAITGQCGVLVQKRLAVRCLRCGACGVFSINISYILYKL